MTRRQAWLAPLRKAAGFHSSTYLMSYNIQAWQPKATAMLGLVVPRPSHRGGEDGPRQCDAASPSPALVPALVSFLVLFFVRAGFAFSSSMTCTKLTPRAHIFFLGFIFFYFIITNYSFLFFSGVWIHHKRGVPGPKSLRHGARHGSCPCAKRLASAVSGI